MEESTVKRLLKCKLAWHVHVGGILNCLGWVGVLMVDDEAGKSEADCEGSRSVSKSRMLNFTLNTMGDYLRYYKLVGNFATSVL